MLANGTTSSRKISLAECTDDQGQLRFREALYVPDYAPLKLEILKLHHDLPSPGHPGRAKTFKLISREFHWPKMRQYIEQYLRNCRAWHQAKPVRHSPFGNLKPLPVPIRPWQEVSMDFVTGLPTSEGFDAILVVVDRLTKMRYIIPCNETATAPVITRRYLYHVWKLHGLPDAIVSDRGPQFTASF